MKNTTYYLENQKNTYWFNRNQYNYIALIELIQVIALERYFQQKNRSDI